MKNDDIERCAPERLAELMDADLGGHGPWDPDELGAFLRHQLNVPVPFDLSRFDEGAADGLKTQCQTEGLLLKSLTELFSHSHPPVELLELTKRYAKACRQDLDSPVPEEIAAVLYFASVGVALVKCHERITTLDDDALTKGIEQVLDWPWLEPSLRPLLQQALDQIRTAEGER